MTKVLSKLKHHWGARLIQQFSFSPWTRTFLSHFRASYISRADEIKRNPISSLSSCLHTFPLVVLSHQECLLLRLRPVPLMLVEWQKSDFYEHFRTSGKRRVVSKANVIYAVSLLLFGVARMWMSDGMLRKALRRESIDSQPNEKFPSRKVNRDTSGFLFRSTRFATDSMFCCSQRYLELGCCFHRIQFP